MIGSSFTYIPFKINSSFRLGKNITNAHMKENLNKLSNFFHSIFPLDTTIRMCASLILLPTQGNLSTLLFGLFVFKNEQDIFAFFSLQQSGSHDIILLLQHSD